MAKQGNELVEVYARPKADRLGDSAPPTKKFEQVNAIIWPRTSTEDASRGEVIIDGLNIWLPAPLRGTVTGTDMVVARGQKWEIEGQPGEFRKGAAAAGLMLVVKRLA